MQLNPFAEGQDLVWPHHVTGSESDGFDALAAGAPEAHVHRRIGCHWDIGFDDRNSVGQRLRRALAGGHRVVLVGVPRGAVVRAFEVVVAEHDYLPDEDAVGLLRFNRLAKQPKELSIDDKPFGVAYKRSSDGATVYRLHPNGRDDRGVVGTNREERCPIPTPTPTCCRSAPRVTCPSPTSSPASSSRSPRPVQWAPSLSSSST